MGLLNVGKIPQAPRRARTGGLLVALAVVLIAIWMLSRVQ